MPLEFQLKQQNIRHTKLLYWVKWVKSRTEADKNIGHQNAYIACGNAKHTLGRLPHYVCFLYLFWLYVIMCTQRSRHHSVCMGVRGHLAGVGSFLPPCKFQGSNSDCDIRQQASSAANALCSPVGIKASHTLSNNSNDSKPRQHESSTCVFIAASS